MKTLSLLKWRADHIVWRHLINIIIQPVGIEIVGCRPPGKQRFVPGIILGVIIPGHFNRKSFGKIPLVLRVQGDPVIFRMAHDKDLPPVLGHSQEQSGFFGFRQDGKPWILADSLQGCLGVAGMRSQKYVVKSPDQRDLPVQDPMPEDAEYLVVKRGLDRKSVV